MILVKNFAVRITRKLKKPDERGNEWKEDVLINEIAFIEGDRYNHTADDLAKQFRDIKLPKDIMVEIVHNFTGTLPEGSPLSISAALQRDGYISPSDANSWFSYGPHDVAESQKFMVQDPEEMYYLKYKLWKESSIAAVDWKQSEQLRKTVELGQPYGPGRPFIREWWM